MKSVLLVLVALVCCSVSALAQLNQEEVAIIQNVYGMEKRAIYSEVMDLSPSDSVAFWPIYDEYEVERKELGKERIKLIEKFVSKYPAIAAEEANDIIEELFDIHEDLIDLERDTYEKIKEKASVLTAAKFVQIEGFLNTVIQAQIQSKLPFIGEFHMKK